MIRTLVFSPAKYGFKSVVSIFLMCVRKCKLIFPTDALQQKEK